jgi:hypothetical protein
VVEIKNVTRCPAFPEREPSKVINLNVESKRGFLTKMPAQRVCMRVAGGWENEVHADLAEQTPANFLTSAA